MKLHSNEQVSPHAQMAAAIKSGIEAFAPKSGAPVVDVAKAPTILSAELAALQKAQR